MLFSRALLNKHPVCPSLSLRLKKPYLGRLAMEVVWQKSRTVTRKVLSMSFHLKTAAVVGTIGGFANFTLASFPREKSNQNPEGAVPTDWYTKQVGLHGTGINCSSFSGSTTHFFPSEPHWFLSVWSCWRHVVCGQGLRQTVALICEKVVGEACSLLKGSQVSIPCLKTGLLCRNIPSLEFPVKICRILIEMSLHFSHIEGQKCSSAWTVAWMSQLENLCLVPFCKELLLH